jgi:3-mercaptopyruvate sulfurtransferase SseA
MRWLGQRLVETAALALLATVLGLAVNAVRREPLPYNLPGRLLLTESGARVVFLNEGRRLFNEAEFVFVDARGDEVFVAGHIEGALSLPPQRFDELYAELQLWTGGQPLLLYGDTGDLLAPDDLAQQLLAAGEERVVILAEGFAAWQAHGHPVDRGVEGLLAHASEGDGREIEEEEPASEDAAREIEEEAP